MYECSICGKECSYKNDYMYTLKDGRKVCKKHKESEKLSASGESYEDYIKRRQSAKEDSVKAKYGVSNVFQLKEVKDKIVEHYQENFDGATNPSQVKEFQDKKKSTSLERYGTSHPMQTQINKDKVVSTCRTRYGTSNVMQVQEFKDNYRSSSLANWGVNNPNQCKKVRDKISSTNLERYGTSMSLSSPEIRFKAEATMESRYGVKHNWEEGELRNKILSDRELRLGVKYYSQSQLFKDMMHEYAKIERNSPQHIQSRIDAAMTYGLEYIERRVRPEDNETVITYKCPYCGVSFDWCQADDPRNPYCHNPECISKYRSKPEVDICNLITELVPNDSVWANNRSILHGKELDIYVPSHKLAIEFDGLYWHDGKDNSYKYEECRKQGIRLIQITEYEWLNKRDIISSILRSAFGIFEHRVYARKCTVKELSDSTYREFLEENHLQGYAPASVRLGLYLGEELIQVESFGKSRYSKEHEWELIRECSKQGYSIIGGKARLFSHFVKEHKPSSVVSYCEKNKFSGDSYIKLGFKLDHESVPGYSYYKSNARYSRLQFQKHKMPDLVGSLLKAFDESLTESENMSANGYIKLYDYGNFVFVWRTGKEQSDS